jgi:hypothetical protein
MSGDRFTPQASGVGGYRLLLAISIRVRESLMRYKPKSIAALQPALGGLPDRMRVEVDSDIEILAKTVRELRR